MQAHILSIVWYKVLPAIYGGQKGIAIFNHCLGQKSKLHCICSKNNEVSANLPYTVSNELPVSKTQFFNPFVRKKILSLIKQQNFSHIILEHPYHAWLHRYKNKYGFKLVVHAHNIEFIRMQERNKWWWPWVKKAEAIAFKKADYILFKTEKDMQAAINIFNTDERKCLPVPYGTAIAQAPTETTGLKEKIRQQHGIDAETKILFFAGSMDYEPNLEALDNIANKILPLLKQKISSSFIIMICGAVDEQRKKTFAGNSPVLFTGFVNDIEDYFRAADVFINPVISGSGIQTKNIDALANNLSVCCTSYSAEGLPAYLSGNKVLIAENNNWEKFTDNILTLLNNAAVTPTSFYDDFYWGNIIDRTLTKIV